MSEEFNIHTMPETGMLKITDTGFTYKGKIKYVQGVLDAFEKSLGGSATKRMKRDVSEVKKISITEEMMEFWP